MLECYYDELLSFLAKSTCNRDEASDLAQETFLRVLTLQDAYEESGKGETIGNPRALLFCTAKNLLVDRYRRERVRPHEDVSSGDLAASDDANPETVVANRQRVVTILSAIETLPPRCRTAFELYKLDGVPQAEIARQMGISRNMVERHVMSGMLECRRCRDEMDCPSVCLQARADDD